MAIRSVLKLEGQGGKVTGTVTTAGYEGWIEISGLEFAENLSGSPGSPGKVSMSDLVIHKDTDRSSPRLFVAGASGEVFDKATFVVLNDSASTPGVLQEWILTTVLVTNFLWQSSSGTPGTSDSATLAFQKIEFGYIPGIAEAKIMYGWDLKNSLPF